MPCVPAAHESPDWSLKQPRLRLLPWRKQLVEPGGVLRMPGTGRGPASSCCIVLCYAVLRCAVLRCRSQCKE